MLRNPLMSDRHVSRQIEGAVWRYASSGIFISPASCQNGGIRRPVDGKVGVFV